MLSPELQDKVRALVEHKISVEELEDWFVPRLPLLLEDPDSDDADLIATIELGLAEMSDGIHAEDEFRLLLEEALSQQTVRLIFPSVQTSQDKTGSANKTTQLDGISVGRQIYEYTVTVL